ncbi:hypothetical protein XHV734_2359 [Xanthomonas hortorum pv. vitians]|nr:hypothetical protein XHV734_2359 [Xanthomonas hortorum pv. vitians]
MDERIDNEEFNKEIQTFGPKLMSRGINWVTTITLISSVTADMDETEVCVLIKPMYFR